MIEKYCLKIEQEDIWDKNAGKDFCSTKEKILLILKNQKVSLSEIRYLFNNILSDIERHNPTVL